MQLVRIAVLAAVVVFTGAAVFAQQEPPRGMMSGPYEDELGSNDPQGGPVSDAKREEVRKKIETLWIWRLTEALKLDEKTSAKVSSLLSSTDQKRRDLMKERQEAMMVLRFSLRSARPDESKLHSLLDKLERNHRATQELRDQELKGLKDILTVEQQARFLVFQQEFRRDMRGMIAGARGGRGAGPGRGRMGGGSGSGQGPGMGSSPYPGGPGGPAENR